MGRVCNLLVTQQEFTFIEGSGSFKESMHMIWNGCRWADQFADLNLQEGKGRHRLNINQEVALWNLPFKQRSI